MQVAAIVVGAGKGERFGRYKQLENLGDKSVLRHSVEQAAKVCDEVVAVVPAELVGDLSLEFADIAKVKVVAGGETRSESVRCGLRALSAGRGEQAVLSELGNSVILVHDAARPLATEQLFQRVIASVQEGADAVIPAVEVSDTVRHISGTPVDRSELRAVQTPQGFKAAILAKAHEGNPEATDDASLVEAVGGKVVLVEGESINIKLTRPEDLAIAEVLMRQVANNSA